MKIPTQFANKNFILRGIGVVLILIFLLKGKDLGSSTVGFLAVGYACIIFFARFGNQFSKRRWFSLFGVSILTFLGLIACLIFVYQFGLKHYN